MLNFLKKLNLLDWVIVVAFFLMICAAVYNFMPEGKETEYIIEISLKDTAELKAGEICTDSENGKEIGKIIDGEGNKFFIKTKGKKAKHGIELKGKIYLKNMPLWLYAGDFYIEARIGNISDN